MVDTVHVQTFSWVQKTPKGYFFQDFCRPMPKTLGRSFEDEERQSLIKAQIHRTRNKSKERKLLYA